MNLSLNSDSSQEDEYGMSSEKPRYSALKDARSPFSKNSNTHGNSLSPGADPQKAVVKSLN